jgi:hypothetical protein
MIHKDLKNKRFGKLLVLEYVGIRKVGKLKLHTSGFWKCKCDCGKIVIVSTSRFCTAKSCGCLNKERLKNGLRYKHGLTETRFYKIWSGIKTRCLNKNEANYKRYGEKGIKICDRWLKFENFRDDMYEAYLKHVKEFGEKNTSIDRIDNDGNYELSNCKWSTRKEQNNNKRNNRLIKYKDKILNLAQWARELKINEGTLHHRICNNNWNIEKAFTTPIRIITYKQ